MAITFTTGNPEQKTFAVLPAGEYNFKVVDSEQKRAKSGNDMIALKLKVSTPDGVEGFAYDNLVFVKNAEWKVDHFLKSAGIHPGQGKQVQLDPVDFIGQQGRLKLSVGKTDKNEPKNEVAAYLWDEEENW